MFLYFHDSEINSNDFHDFDIDSYDFHSFVCSYIDSQDLHVFISFEIDSNEFHCFYNSDVDSYDFELLKGSVKTLQTLKPIITVELNHALHLRNATEQEVVNWLSEMDYSLSHITNDENHTFIYNKK